MNIDLAGVTQAQAVVLVEGMSGKAALEALAERRGQMPGGGGICVVAMGGAASAGPALAPGRGFQRASVADETMQPQEGFREAEPGLAAQPGHQPAALGRPRQHRRR